MCWVSFGKLFRSCDWSQRLSNVKWLWMIPPTSRSLATSNNFRILQNQMLSWITKVKHQICTSKTLRRQTDMTCLHCHNHLTPHCSHSEKVETLPEMANKPKTNWPATPNILEEVQPCKLICKSSPIFHGEVPETAGSSKTNLQSASLLSLEIFDFWTGCCCRFIVAGLWVWGESDLRRSVAVYQDCPWCCSGR